MESDTIDAWSSYWRSGRGASCFAGADAELRLTEVWNELVDNLADGSRLLDLATGNGTLVRLCAARASERNIDLRIDAVDAAAIDPPKYAADTPSLFDNVSFHGNVQLENLPFPDRSFDTVISQFGFEYADEVRAADEAGRVLAEGGRLRLVMHARDGAVSQDVGQRVERLQRALADNGAITLVRTLARAAAAGDLDTLQSASAQLPEAARTIQDLAKDAPPDDAAVYYSREFIRLWHHRERYWPAELRRSIDDGWENAHGVAIRQAQMLRVARSASDVEVMSTRFGEANLVVDAVREIRDEQRGIQIAWLLDARKPSGS
ncbi:MAG TPA: class I SAM-dependent methyltransferase [Woeseiaceae bacterium]